LSEHGFEDVQVLVGGMNAWRDKGYPLVPKDEKAAVVSGQ